MTIYKITNSINGKIYIGKTISLHHRKTSHLSLLRRGLHKNSCLQSDWLTFGETSFSFNTIEDNIDLIDADKRERYWIKLYNSFNNEMGYNLESGGNLNKKLSDETKRKISESHIGQMTGFKNVKSRPVVGLSVKNYDIKVFENISAASQYIKTCTSNISRVCKHELKQIKGWKFAYIPEKKKAEEALALGW